MREPSIVVDILTVMIAVCVPLIDPIIAIFYGAAAYFGKTPTMAAAFGLLAGMMLIGIDIFLRGSGAHYAPSLAFTRLATCVIGATVARLVTNAIAKRRGLSAAEGD